MTELQCKKETATYSLTEKEISRVDELCNYYETTKSNLIKSLINNHYEKLKEEHNLISMMDCDVL